MVYSSVMLLETGGPRGKDDALAAGKLIHIAAFGEHVGGLLRIRGGKPRHIAHLGEKEQW